MLRTLAILATITTAGAAELLPGEPCDACDIGPYIEQRCADDMSQVLLTPAWFDITNPAGETLPFLVNICVLPQDEDFGEFEGIWHDVSYDFGFIGGFAGGGGGGFVSPSDTFGRFIPFAVQAAHEDHTMAPNVPTPGTPETPPPAVPIPGTLWLFGAGLAVLGLMMIGRGRWLYSRR